MRCFKCGTDNREGRKFCSNCGASLTGKCPQCGAPNEPSDRFCGECGGLLDRSPRESPAPARPVELGEAASAAEAIEGERKTITALFADIKGSTELLEKLDPEEARVVV